MQQLLDQIMCSDCLDALSRVPDQCVDLAYLDPPFNTGRTMAGRNGSYADSWDGVEGHLHMMEPRLRQVHRVLSPTGSILLHCDWRTCHHLRRMLDEIFGPEQFVNHLIWRYGLGGSSPRRFARKHDDILFYSKTDDYWFKPPMVPAQSARMKGMMKKATDVIDVPSLNNMASERCGYPTQKPVALLELLISACCPPGGLVLDPFCGSGTTLVAAAHLARRYIGIDINDGAISIASDRLAVAMELGVRSQELGVRS